LSGIAEGKSIEPKTKGRNHETLYIHFVLVYIRITANDDDSTKENAKQWVEGFIRDFEGQLNNIDKFYKAHIIIFDIKSEKNGSILYSGKKDKEGIWWQF